MDRRPFRINASLATFSSFAERYVPGGYFDAKSMDEVLETVSDIEGVKGMGVWYPGHPLIETPHKLKKRFADHGLEVADIGPDLWTENCFRYGALSTHEKKIRKQAIDIAKKTVDLAIELDAYSVLIWPAHDGFDYCFQSDYLQSYDHLTDSLAQIADHNKKVKIAIEYKQKDPRAKSYIEDIGKALYMVKSIDAKNLGVALDLGHSLFAQERPAESLALLAREDKLYQIHLNDNYRDGDPDLVFGSINFWDTLEMFYWLLKTDYKGWLNIDTCSQRNDPEKMLQLAVGFIQDYERLARRLYEHRPFIDDHLKKNQYVENLAFIRKIVFPS